MLKPQLNKIILCATAKNLVAGIWHANRLQQYQVFEHHDIGLQSFQDWLAQFPNIPVYLIANAVEEDYRLESLPHSTGKEKRALIARKLNQFYRGLVFRTAHFIGREKDKRKDDKFLFVALNNDEFLQDWLNCMQEADVPLVGVYLLPMLSQILCRQLASPQKLAPDHVLLCEKLSSGLRQTYLHNGRLRMSRLIPNMPSDNNQLGYFYLVETQKTRLYLMSKRFISRDITLNLQLVSHHDDMQAIKQSFSQEPGIDCETLNLHALSKPLNMHAIDLEAQPELLHMQLLANGNPVDNLAPEALTKTFQLTKLSLWIQKSALAMAVCGLIASAYFVMTGLEHQSDAENTQQAAEITQERYRDIANHFPKTPVKAQDLKTAVLLHQQIQDFPSSPQRLMHAVSQALEKSPEITLDRLRWVQTHDVNFIDNEDLKGLSADLTANSASLNNAQLTELGFISAEIVHFNGDYRAAMQSVQQFAEYLKKQTDVAQVEILQLPVNTSSYTDISGSTAGAQQQALAPALFKIKLQLKPHNNVTTP